ncbi:801_t:CDS:1, partial [Acaulospora morrowiae]
MASAYIRINNTLKSGFIYIRIISQIIPPSIDHITSIEETSITENSNQINIPNKQVKNRKPKFRGIAYPMSQKDAPTGLKSNKSVWISDSSNSGASINAHIINKSDIPNALTKKAEKDDMYTLIECDCKESEVTECGSERILAT